MNIETINYKNLEWYIIKETNEEKLLFLKDCLTNEQTQKYFTDKNMVDESYDVRFNKDKTCPWWEDSYIREILNGPFLADLNKAELNIMRTTLKFGSEEKTTEDYVRLLTVEEARILPEYILNVDKKYGYFTMSPYYFNGSNASVFGVYGSGRIPSYYVVYGTSGVRPVVSLKSNNLITDIDENKIDLLKEMKRVIKL